MSTFPSSAGARPFASLPAAGIAGVVEDQHDETDDREHDEQAEQRHRHNTEKASSIPAPMAAFTACISAHSARL